MIAKMGGKQFNCAAQNIFYEMKWLVLILKLLVVSTFSVET
jgi:hypothetical protein